MNISQIENGLKKAEGKIMLGTKNKDRTMIESGLKEMDNIYWLSTPDQIAHLNGNSLSILTAWGYIDSNETAWLKAV